MNKNIENSIFIKNKKSKKKLLKNKSNSLNSFSPRVNKLLVSYTKKKPQHFYLCNNNLLKINIGDSNIPKCVNYNTQKAQQFLLNNLKSIKNIDCNTIIPPKQYLANCWFNTFFVTFFISDKGRKFFKFFRQLMILGKKVNGELIPKNLREAFFILNIAIESSYNPSLSNIAYIFNTNLLIQKIYQVINSKSNKSILSNIPIHIPNINEPGNPLDYYFTIISYLNANSINILPLFLNKTASNDSIEKIVKDINITNKPDIIIIEIIDNESKIINDKSRQLDIFGVKYKLDSAIIRDTNQQHFCSLLTCNKNEYAFDGASYNRIIPMKWKNLLNKNETWKFKGHNLKWSFRNSYQILFYYRE